MGSRAYRSLFKGVDPHDLLTWLLLPQWSNKNGEDWVDFGGSAENTGSSKFIYPQALFVPSPFYLQQGVGGGWGRSTPWAGEGVAEEGWAKAWKGGKARWCRTSSAR